MVSLLLLEFMVLEEGYFVKDQDFSLEFDGESYGIDNNE